MADLGAELASQEGGLAHSTVPVANNGLGNQGSEVVVILPADTLNGEGNVSGGNGVVTETDLRANELGGALHLSSESGGGGGRGLAGEATEVLLGEANELLVGDATSTDQNHTVSGVVGLNVVGQVLPADGLDVLLGAEDGTTKGLALVSGGVQVVKNNLLKLLVNLLLLAQDDVALALDGGRLELRVLEDIGKDVDSLGNIGVERLGVVDGVLALYIEKVSDELAIKAMRLGFPVVPRCRRSGGRPCSRSPARVGAGSACWYPKKKPVHVRFLYLFKQCIGWEFASNLEGKVLKEVSGSVGLVSL